VANLYIALIFLSAAVVDVHTSLTPLSLLRTDLDRPVLDFPNLRTARTWSIYKVLELDHRRFSRAKMTYDQPAGKVPMALDQRAIQRGLPVALAPIWAVFPVQVVHQLVVV